VSGCGGRVRFGGFFWWRNVKEWAEKGVGLRGVGLLEIFILIFLPHQWFFLGVRSLSFWFGKNRISHGIFTKMRTCGFSLL
jgi:hypothetical protein